MIIGNKKTESNNNSHNILARVLVYGTLDLGLTYGTCQVKLHLYGR